MTDPLERPAFGPASEPAGNAAKFGRDRRPWGLGGLVLWAALATAIAVAALEEEDPLWVGLPPAPGVLHLAPPPETEAEFAAELAAEAEAAKAPPPSAAPPRDDLFHQDSDIHPDPDLFFSPDDPGPPSGSRPAYPEILEEIFNPEAPAE